jgi:hypothetical protein
MKNDGDKLTPQVTAELAGIAGEIRSVRSEYETILRRGAACAKRVGELLLKAQPLCERQWAKWLAVELDMVTETAKKYMTIAENWERIESHEKFPNIGVLEMYDIARGRKHNKPKYSAVCRKLDTLINALDQRISELVGQFPELADLLDAIDNARGLLEREGLLGSQYETRKQQMMLRKRAG